MIKERLIDYISESIRKNWDKEALSNYREEGYTYRTIAEKMLKFHAVFSELGIKEGDKIALVGKNSADWCVTYLAVVTYGAVIVPILPDFKPEDLTNIINHSDAQALFIEDKIWEVLKPEDIPEVRAVVSLSGFTPIHFREKAITKVYEDMHEAFDQKYPDFNPDDITFSDITNDKLAVISYTSGTTGFSKGVMIPHNSLAANVRYAQRHMPLDPGDPIVSFLPLAHTFGGAFEFLFPFTLGCHITILTKTPSPQIIIQAFKEIRPRLILSVPLVIEKIYKKQVMPVIQKPAMKVMLALPGLKKVVHNKIKDKLNASFGGRFREVVIGGAALNPDAEKFFRRIGFKFTVGYGMTECGPLISYASWDTTKPGASGRPVDTLEVTIDSENPQTQVGEIILRGENVMDGYYKNEEATNEIIDKDGWMHTGDLGLMDAEGNIFIKGRSKSMLLGASGKNIYPEEVESVINNQYLVSQSVVIQENEKLVALINVDKDAAKQEGVTPDQLEGIMEQNRKAANERLPSYMNVSKYRIHEEEFAITPKRSIKRFLYQK